MVVGGGLYRLYDFKINMIMYKLSVQECRGLQGEANVVEKACVEQEDIA